MNRWRHILGLGRTPTSKFPTEPPVELCPDRETYKMRARIISDYFGHLTKGFKKIMTGTEGTVEAHAFNKEHAQSVSDYVPI